jgi:hypothetical protein
MLVVGVTRQCQITTTAGPADERERGNGAERTMQRDFPEHAAIMRRAAQLRGAEAHGDRGRNRLGAQSRRDRNR